MRYSKEQKLDIGRQLYNHEITRKEAMEKYGCKGTFLDTSIKAYKESIGVKTSTIVTKHGIHSPKKIKSKASTDIDAYMAMSKEELIDELIRAKANELRAKKGYEVKGVGANKEFISLSNKNTK